MIEVRNGVYRVIAKWRRLPAFSITVGKKKEDAEAYDRVLNDLRDNGRVDVLQAIKDGEVSLREAYVGVQESGARRYQLPENGIQADEEEEAVPVLTLGEVRDEFLAWIRNDANHSPRTGRPWRESTVERYEQNWAALVAVLGESMPASDLTENALTHFRQTRIERGVSHSTVNRDFTAIEAALHWASRHRKKWGLVKPEFDKSKEPKGALRLLEPAEWLAFCEHCEPDWLPFMKAQAYCGLRISEAANLLASDVDLEVMRLSVLSRENARTKTDGSVRQIPIPPPLEPDMRALKAAAQRRSDHVFDEVRRNYNEAYRAFERACIAAGLHDSGEAYRARLAKLEAREKRGEVVTKAEYRRARYAARLRLRHSPHSLRHTYGASLAREGVPVTEICRLMGHSTIATTERYMWYRDDKLQQQRQSDAITRALAGPATSSARNVLQTGHSPELPQIKARSGLPVRAARAESAPPQTE